MRKVIIWGVDDYNVLGLYHQLRNLYDITFIVFQGVRHCASLSKYCTKLVELSTLEEGLEYLLANFNDEQNKAVIINSNDLIAEFLDPSWMIPAPNQGQLAIEMRLDKEGFLSPYVDTERCIECENCVSCCTIVNPSSKKKAVARYGIPKEKYVDKSEICSSIISNAYKLGIKVCGSKYEEDFKSVKQDWLEDESEVAVLSETKPVLGNPTDTYKKTKEYLKQGIPVLYVARACQLDGLYKYIGTDENKLYTMEVKAQQKHLEPLSRNILVEKE